MDLYLNTAFIIFIYFNIFYLLSFYTKDYSVVDIGWGAGFVVIAGYALLNAKEVTIGIIITAFLLLLWGTRLTVYILIRHHKKPEDFRYKAMRDSWGKTAWLQSYFKIFMLQAMVMWLMALPIAFQSAQEYSHLSLMSLLFAILALAGIVYETIADYELYVFKLNPANKGKTLRSGLWEFSRHPNYFGELVFWWGLGIFVTLDSSMFFGLLSPIIITLLLLFVSGVPLVEDRRKDDPEYAAYVASTNRIIPMFTKPSN